ncbi:unnamed protein product [Rotaria sp. Silwood2]|nr:unnamed protein product [Rotaria sp. Silwood2]
MTNKSLKIDVDVSMYESIDELKDSPAIDNIMSKVVDILKKKGQKASNCSLLKYCKNAVSLLWSKKKETSPNLLIVYLPLKVLEYIQDTVVPNVSSDEEVSESGVDNESIDNVTDCQLPLPVSSSSHISFSVRNNMLEAEASFEYLLDYFKHSLSMNSKSLNFDKILNDICTYVFIELKSSVNIRTLKKEISLQISHIVQSARYRAADKSIIKTLRISGNFSLVFKCISPLNKAQSIREFCQFRNNIPLGPILLHRTFNEKNDILQFFPFSNTIEVTFNGAWIERVLSAFDFVGIIDVDDLCYLINECASTYNLKLDFNNLVETLKTEILCCRTKSSSNSNFLTVVVRCIEPNNVRKDHSQNSMNDYQSLLEVEMDSIVGRTYATRGVKRSYVEDSISIEPDRNLYRLNKEMKDKRDLLHLKDTYHLTDSAFNAIFHFIQNKKKLYSLSEIERLRKETNSKFPIFFTTTSAYVKFEYAVRTAIFVAQYYEPNLEQFETLHIRFNMDGTLIGNKHIVAISINCIEGGHPCQMATNLIPVGLFEVQKENTELLRKTLPIEFINDIKSVKRISIGAKDIDILIRLGGDLMNAVYVFGLSGFSSNYPCIFCTQHKDDLHVTEDTAYDKTISEGKGKNKKTTTVHIGPTSYHDTSKRARSLFEQAACLPKKTNDLGYKCEPLFGDLFDYQDYCIDTLHMKLRIFDVILKDILSHASRTGKYGDEHVVILKQKVEILNQHCDRTVGKRFFFQIDSENNNKTIASHGKLSGHLQDLFFVDSFPYDDILRDDIAKSARLVVNKFKEILNEISHNTIRRKGVLKRLSLEFVKEFRQSGLRTTVTPYIHIIGNHLFEFDEFNNLGDYNMQGVEKNNDLLSQLYFSSTNPAKNPLLTMLQKLYRMLEMNFQDEKERDAMGKFARTGVYDFVEDNPCESETDAEDDTIFCRDENEYIESEVERDEQLNSSIIATEEDNDETELEDSLIWEPEKRFGNTFLPRSQNRFKSFRRS